LKAHELADALNACLLVAPEYLEQCAREMERQTGKCLDRRARSEVLGIELAPDRRIALGVGVLVDRNMKVVGAFRIPLSS